MIEWSCKETWSTHTILKSIPCFLNIGVSLTSTARIKSLGVSNTLVESTDLLTNDSTASTSSCVWPTDRWLWFVTLKVRDWVRASISRLALEFRTSWCVLDVYPEFHMFPICVAPKTMKQTCAKICWSFTPSALTVLSDCTWSLTSWKEPQTQNR